MTTRQLEALRQQIWSAKDRHLRVLTEMYDAQYHYYCAAEFAGEVTLSDVADIDTLCATAKAELARRGINR